MSDAAISIRQLTMAYGDNVIQRDLSFDVQRGDIFVIMGGSGWQEHPAAPPDRLANAQRRQRALRSR